MGISKQRLLLHLYSTKNIAGSLLALLGLGLFFVGIIGWPLWPAIVVAMYLIGVLVTPGTKSYDLTGDVDADDLKKALATEVRAVSGKVPPDVLGKVESIQQTILDLLPHMSEFPPGSPDLFVVQRTAVDYLPTALESYLNLPKAYATLHPVENGKTAKQVLLDQLTLLDSKMDEVADAVHKKDSERLLANGRFLAERFGRSALSLPASGSEAAS